MTRDIEEQLGRFQRTTSAELDQHILNDAFAAMTSASEGPPTIPTKTRIFTMKRISRIAVAAAIVLGVVGTITWLTSTNGGASIVFADVVANAKKASSLSLDGVFRQPGEAEVRYHIDAMGARYRKANLTNGMLQVADGDQGKLMQIVLHKPADPDKAPWKSVRITPYKTETDNPIEMILGKIDEFIAGEVETLGEKVLDGRQVRGFRANITDKIQRRQTIEVWVDIETNYPVQMEIFYGKAGVQMIFTKFVWNPELDDSLFDLTPPEGYEVDDQTQ
jgi:hypothetical protein